MKVSVVAITLNEEDMLPHFLNYYSEVAAANVANRAVLWISLYGFHGQLSAI